MPKSKKKKRNKKPHSSSETIAAAECGIDEKTDEIFENSQKSFSNEMQGADYRRKLKEQETSIIETNNCMQSADLKATIESTKKLLRDLKNMDNVYEDFVDKTGNRLTQEFLKSWEEALRDICKVKYESVTSMERAPIVSVGVLIERKLFVKTSLDKSIRDKEFQSSCSFYTLLGLCLSRYIRILESLLPSISNLSFVTELGTVRHFFERWNDALEVVLLGCDAMSLIKAAKAFDLVEELQFTFNYVRENVKEKRLLNNLLAVSDFISNIIKERSNQNYKSSKNLQENYVFFYISDQRYDELQWELKADQTKETEIYSHFLNSTITAFLRFDGVIVSKKNQTVSNLIQAGLKKLRSIHQKDCLVDKYSHSEFFNNNDNYKAEEKLTRPIIIDNELSLQKQLIKNCSYSNCNVTLSDKDKLESTVPVNISVLTQPSSTSDHYVSAQKESAKCTQDSFHCTKDIETFLSPCQPSENSVEHLENFTACANDFEGHVGNMNTFVEKVVASKSWEDESSSLIVSQTPVDDNRFVVENCALLREDTPAASFERKKDLSVKLDENDSSVDKLSALGESITLATDTVAFVKEKQKQVKEFYSPTENSTLDSVLSVSEHFSASKEETKSSTEELAELLNRPSIPPESRFLSANISVSLQKKYSLQNESVVSLKKSQSLPEVQPIKLDESATAFINDSLASDEDHIVLSLALKNTRELDSPKNQTFETDGRPAPFLNKLSDSAENFTNVLDTHASTSENFSTEISKKLPVLPNESCSTPKKIQELLPENNFPGRRLTSMIEDHLVSVTGSLLTKKETCKPVKKDIEPQDEVATVLKKNSLPVEEGDSYEEPYLLKENLPSYTEKLVTANKSILLPDNLSEVFNKSSKGLDFVVLERENSFTDEKCVVLPDEPTVTFDKMPKIVDNVCLTLEKSAVLQNECIEIFEESPSFAEISTAHSSKSASVFKEVSVALREVETLDRRSREIDSYVQNCATIVKTPNLSLNKLPIIKEDLNFEKNMSNPACNELLAAPLEDLPVHLTGSDKALSRFCESAHETVEIFSTVENVHKTSNLRENITTLKEKTPSGGKECTLLTNKPTAAKAHSPLEKSCSLHLKVDSSLENLSKSIDEICVLRDDLAESSLTSKELNITQNELAKTSQNTVQTPEGVPLSLSTVPDSQVCASDLNSFTACIDNFKTSTENATASLIESVPNDSAIPLEDLDTNQEITWLPTETLAGRSKKSTCSLNSFDTNIRHSVTLLNDFTAHVTKSSSSVLIDTSENNKKVYEAEVEDFSTPLKEHLVHRKKVVLSANKNVTVTKTNAKTGGLYSRHADLDDTERESLSSVESSSFFKSLLKLSLILSTLCIIGVIYMCCVR